jgi:hypothetical protein
MDIPTKINLDELFEYNKHQNLNTIKTYHTILDRIHARIKIASRQKIENQCCWYVVPEVLLGVQRYDLADAIAYIIHQLQENGFQLKYTHPNLLFISWAHWIPDYVRVEYKKKTGIAIDGFGKEIKEKESEPKKSIFKSTSSYKPSGIIYSDDIIKLV